MDEKTIKNMKDSAGWRERYAMKHGHRAKKIENGHVLIVYTYSKNAKYQDANGATYDVTRGAWIA